MSFRDKNALLSQYFCKTLLSDSVIVNSEGYFNKEDITSDAVQLAFSEMGFLISSYFGGRCVETYIIQLLRIVVSQWGSSDSRVSQE